MGFLIIMVGISLGYSLIHTPTLQQSLLIWAFSFAISIPTAYLARESSKHREKQHLYLQTYLDLVAINPYIDKMDERDKYKIKAMVANRIFSKVNSSGNNSDSYPINMQQPIEKLIDNVDVKTNKSNTE